MTNPEFPVSLQSLALPGEGGDVAPAVGDEVDISGTAAVSRVEGDKAFLTLKTVNGEAIESAAPKKPQTLDDEESELRADATKADQARLY
jgi:hypothetical protein